MRVTVRSLLVAVAALFSLHAFAAPAREHDTVTLEIALQPSNAIVQQVRQASRVLAGKDLKTPYSRGLPAGITLLLTSFPASAMPEIRRVIKDIAAHQHVLPLRTAGTTLTDNHWLFLTLEDNATLQALRERIITRLKPLHAGIKTPGVPASAAERDTFAIQTGDRHTRRFEPHIVLLSARDQKGTPEKSNATDLPAVQGHGLALLIGRVNEQGLVTRVVARYSLLPGVMIRKETQH